MKRKIKRKMPAVVGRPTTRGTTAPTLFDEVVVITSAFREEMGLARIEAEHQPKVEMPSWGRNIVKRLGKTIFKPVLKLRPNGKVDWRNYGRAIGIVERAKAFWEHDVPRILAEEFADLTDQQVGNIEHQLGLGQLRARCVKVLGRAVTEDEPLEKLIDEVWDREMAYRERVRQMAFAHVAQQPPKVAVLFYRGLQEGYTIFLDENGAFSGERGRTEAYLSLLSCMLDVEKLRRTQPPTTRARFYDSLTEVFKLPPKAYDWFNDVCDDIKFPLNNLGRPRQGSSPSL